MTSSRRRHRLPRESVGPDLTSAALAAASLFEPPVISRLAVIGALDGEAGYPEEAALVARAAPERRAAFLAGRACARQALAEAGAAPGPILRAGRAPAWPPGFAGSISHGAGLAWAVAASRRQVAALGIDVEEAAPLPANVVARIADREERAAVAALEIRIGEAAGAVLWAAKEALFKCLSQLAPGGAPPWPAVVLALDGATQGRFALRCDDGADPISGAWRLAGGRVFAGCQAPAPERGPEHAPEHAL